MVRKVKKGTRGKKKRWFQVIASKEFGEQSLGEVYGHALENCVGKRLRVGLMEIAREPKAQNVKILFKIVGVREGKAVTKVEGYSLVSSYVKRIMRKNVRKIDDSFVCETKDKLKIRIKPFLLARGKPSYSKVKDLRKKVAEILTEEVKKKDFGEFLRLVTSNRIQKSLKDTLRKLYPISACELRVVKLE